MMTKSTGMMMIMILQEEGKKTVVEGDEERGEDAEQKTVQRPAHVSFFVVVVVSQMTDFNDDFDEKGSQFDKLWDSENRSKRLKFRQYMKNHVLQKFHKRNQEQTSTADKGHYNHSFSSDDQFLTRENCKKYWMGELQKEIKDAETF